MRGIGLIDWKVLVFALFGCYFIPWVTAGVVVRVFLEITEDATRHQGALGLVFLASTVLSPLLAGYFTARFAANRPLLHVLLIALLGPMLQAVASGQSVLGYLGYVALTAACCALGAFIALRQGVRGA